MTRSLEIRARTYPSFGRCIFCGRTDQLTDEHIVPKAISGIGEMMIADGSCKYCNGHANKFLENPALQNDLLVIRNVLSLKRRRRGIKQLPRRMPRVGLGDIDLDSATADDLETELAPEDYPPVAKFFVHPPAGLLTGTDRSNGPRLVRMYLIPIRSSLGALEGRVVTCERHVLGAPELLVAKMAYCYAVAEKGPDFVDLTDLKDLLAGRRSDVFNFVGNPNKYLHLPITRLHSFHFFDRGRFLTVMIHLFASFHGPQYEVVLGRK